jgi:hypothetical protein
MRPQGFNYMKVNLGTLKDKGEQLAAFLEPRVGVRPSLSGDAMEIEDGGVREGVKPRQVKTYVKRFLFMNGARKNYRVFVQGKDLTLQEIELGEEEEEAKEKTKPESKQAEPAKGEAKLPAQEPEEETNAKPKKPAAKKPRKKKDESDS